MTAVSPKTIGIKEETHETHPRVGTLSTIGQVRREAVRLYKDLRAGKIPHEIASKGGYLLNLIQGLIPLEKVEKEQAKKHSSQQTVIDNKVEQMVLAENRKRVNDGLKVMSELDEKRFRIEAAKEVKTELVKNTE